MPASSLPRLLRALLGSRLLSTASSLPRATAAAPAARSPTTSAPRARLPSPASPSRGRPRLPPTALLSARIALRKRLGQHLLINSDVVRRIVDAACVRPEETAFEIGPGTGALTLHLLERARAVYAVELDARLQAVLLSRVAAAGLAHKLQCVRADFLTVALPRFDVLVANIPYQISSPVLRRIFTARFPPSRAVIMFQKEFAERLIAQPGSADYCRLSVNTQLLCGGPAGVRILMRIGREQFRPPPKVDSAVAQMVPLPGGWPAVCAAWPQVGVEIASGGKQGGDDGRGAEGGGSGAGALAVDSSGGGAGALAVDSSGGGAGALAVDSSGLLPPAAAAGSSGLPAIAAPFAPAFSEWDVFMRIAFSGKNKTLRAIFANKSTLSALLAATEAAAVAAQGKGEDGAGTVLDLPAEEEAEVAVASGEDSDDEEAGADHGDEADSAAGAQGEIAAWDGLATPRIRSPRVRHSQVPPPTPAAVLLLRAEMHAILDALELSDKRPNALRASDFQRLFRAMRQGRGLRFTYTPGMRAEVFKGGDG